MGQKLRPDDRSKRPTWPATLRKDHSGVTPNCITNRSRTRHRGRTNADRGAASSTYGLFSMELLSAPVPDEFRSLRRFALDDALLLFDRSTGLNVLCDGPEYVGLRQKCPRVVQFGITNRCNMNCEFCSRDLASESRWTSDSAFLLLRDLADRGVLEVAFGGGEPLVFPGFLDLVRRLHCETPLAVNVTTNGLKLTRAVLETLAPRVGQLRLSLYEENDWRTRVALLAGSQLRFGVNYLVTPERLADLELVVFEMVDLGCRDILLLSYNGEDPGLHLGPTEVAHLDRSVATLSAALSTRARICLDVCWGSRLTSAPKLFDNDDCGAGREFMVVTSDHRVSPCSFHDDSERITTADDALRAWERMASDRAPSVTPGCARASDFGLPVATSVPVLMGGRS